MSSSDPPASQAPTAGPDVPPGGRPSDSATWIDPSDEDEAAAAAAPPRFRVEEELARGGLGRVLRAWDGALERVVALKTLLRTSPAAQARFRREALLTARLQHPNIVPVYDGGVDEAGTPFFAMRLVAGHTLTQEIAGRPTLEARLELLPQVIAACNAVAYAHQQRVAHRDLKPDNLLVGAFGEAVVIDWGLAKDLDTHDEATDPGERPTSGSSSSLTRVGAVMGTPAYMPPEQAGGRPVGTTADVYALGAVLYETLSGVRPYRGSEDIVAAVLAGPPEAVVSLAPGAPRDLVAVVEKAMARDPAARYPDARALAAELERFQAGRFVDAHHYTLAERARRLILRNRAASALGVLLLVGTAAAFLMLDRARVRAREAESDARHERDDATLVEARLVAERDPRRSLALLATLAPDPARDGAVRTIAATALAAGIPEILPPPAGDGSLGGLTGTAEAPIASWGRTLVRYDRLRPQLLAHADAPIRVPVAFGDRVLFWTADRLRTVSWRGGVPSEAGPVASVFSAGADASGGAFAVALGSGLWRFAPDGTPTLRKLDASSPRSAPGPDGGTWISDDVRRAVGFLAADGSVAWAPAGTPYGLVVAGDGVFALGADPPLTRVTRGPEGLRAEVVPVPADWLESGVFLPPDTLVAGGGEPALLVIGGDDRIRRVEIGARPRSLVGLGPRRVAAGLEDGRVAVVRADGGVERVVPSSEEPIRFLLASADGASLVAGGSRQLARHALAGAHGDLVAQVGGRVWELLAEEDGLWIAGAGGLHRLAGARLEQLDRQPVRALVACGDRVWTGGSDGLRAWPEGARHHASPVASLACGPGWLLAVFESGALLALDPTSGAVLREDAGEETPGWPRIAVTDDGRALVGGVRASIVDPLRRRPDEPLAVGSGDAVDAAAGQAWFGALDGTVWRVSPDRARLTHFGDAVTSVTRVGEDLVIGDASGALGRLRGDELSPMAGHSQYVSRMAPRPGGRWVASGAWDATAILWDLSVSPPAGRPLRGHADAVVALAWSPDGSVLWTGGRAGEVRRWTDDLPPGGAPLRDAIAEALAR